MPAMEYDDAAADRLEAVYLGPDVAAQRADTLAEPGRTEIQTARLAYARTRVVEPGARINTPETAAAFVGRSLERQARLWPTALRATAEPTAPAIRAS